MDRMAILTKAQKQYEGKSERGEELQQPPPPLLREKRLIETLRWRTVTKISFKFQKHCTYRHNVHDRFETSFRKICRNINISYKFS